MSVTFVSGAATELPSSQTPPLPPASAEAGLAATRATTFLRAQAQWLRRGLLHGDDRVAVDLVLSAHDRSHDRWVATIRLVDAALGDEAANRIAAVYAYMGRVAGSLDGNAMELLECKLAVQVRAYLVERLVEVTEAAVDYLWAVAAEA